MRHYTVYQPPKMLKRKRYFVKSDGLLGFDWSLDWNKKPKVTELLDKTKKKIRSAYANISILK